MSKYLIGLIFMLSVASISACKSSTVSTKETCEFNFTVLGYSLQQIAVLEGEDVIYDKVTGAIEPATEITGFSQFYVSVPAELTFRVAGDVKHRVKVKNCEKLGIVLDERGREVVLINMEDYIFQ